MSSVTSDKFREEMGYSPRNESLWGGIGTSKDSYGAWPSSWNQIYGINPPGGSYGLSLMQTHYIRYFDDWRSKNYCVANGIQMRQNHVSIIRERFMVILFIKS